MSQLTVYAESDPKNVLLDTKDFEAIRDALAEADIAFERWPARRSFADDADSDTILAAYQQEIERLIDERGYQSFDVVSMNAEHPDREALRKKFLSEHTHSEDEVRFFVRGQGLFVIHVHGKVFSMLCTQDDLISVPAGIRHWFDMGPAPSFTAIRLFNDPSGWVADFTGDTIAERFPGLG